jgi:hypothetical protein
MKPFLVVACIAMLALSCDPWTHLDDDDDDGGGRSGFGRWTVKTGHDEDVRKVSLVPQTTTIAELRAKKPPSNLSGDSARFTYSGSPEIQTYRLTNVTLAGYKQETDGDYHLVLVDAGKSLIAEIVDPRRVAEGWKARTTQARHAFDARHAASGSFQTAGETVTVSGVGFFDLLHGQFGAAPNGIELHAVLDICFGPDCGSAEALKAAAGPP